MQCELHADLDGTLATMVENPHLLNLGSGTGGMGMEGVREFYATKLIGQFFPPDVEFITISRTENEERLVDELVIRLPTPRRSATCCPGCPPRTGESRWHWW
jgi:carboxymethylenebutenolidase